MPFQTDPRVRELEQFYGEYRTTFVSENGQVRAEIFRQGDWLEAHVYSPNKTKLDEVTDRYVTDLEGHAREQGYEDRFRMIFSGW
jgi:hypothetical protein